MTDRYQQLVNAPFASELAKRLGLPRPVELRRHEPGQPPLDGPVLLGGTDGARLRDTVEKILAGEDVPVLTEVPDEPTGPGDSGDGRVAALVFDASGIDDPAGLHAVYAFLHTTIRRLGRCGRVLVLGTDPSALDDPAAAAAQRALDGFVRSVAKELRAGSTANLVQVAPGAEDGADSAIRFVLSARSAYVNGQVVTVGPALEESRPTVPTDLDRPHQERVAVVTGAAQGIGLAIAETLARDGAHVVVADLPAKGDTLTGVANRLGGTALQLDITAADAPERLADHLDTRFDGVDVVVHNAGITRDKTIAGMDDARWDSVIDVNLASQLRINRVLLDRELVNRGGRIVCVSSTSGIAGNRGQSNYAASKAGVIGMVEALAPELADAGATINAVAPGFIETEMTGHMPAVVREVGRRINSLNQGGQPVDVAETISWLAHPGSAWINGQVVRVCGQSILGA